MKILLLEEPEDRYAAVVMIVNALEKLQRSFKVYSGIYLVTDRKNTWEIAGSIKVKGVISRKAASSDLLEALK